MENAIAENVSVWQQKNGEVKMQKSDLIDEITTYLSNGGLFNPELANHIAVRDLLIECRKALAQPKQETVALQMDVIVVNLVREGINKHRARELAEHFIRHTTPPQRKPLTENEIKHLWYEACQTNLELTSQLIVHLARAIEAAHGIKE